MKSSTRYKTLKIFFLIALVLFLSTPIHQSSAFTSTADDAARLVAAIMKSLGKNANAIKEHRAMVNQIGAKIDDFVPHIFKYSRDERVSLLLEVAEQRKLIKGTEKLRVNHALLNGKFSEEDLIELIRRDVTIEKWIGGRKVIHNEYAGKVYHVDPERYASVAKKYPEGVRFSDDGYPDFRPYAKEQVSIADLTGDRYKDANKANQKAGMDRTPEGYTWHHHQDCKTMILVPAELHQAVRHSGGAEKINKGSIKCPW